MSFLFFRYGETTAAKNLAAFESTLRDSLVAAQTGWDEKKLTPQQQREEARKITFGLLKDQALAGTQTIPIIGSNTHKRVLNMTPEERCEVLKRCVCTVEVGAEVAARIAEKAIFELSAPIIRVGSHSLPYPFPGYENYYIPNALKISKAIDKVLEA